MLPPPGPYRLTSTSPPGAVWQVTVTPTGMQTPLGPFNYDAPGDVFVRPPAFAVECLGSGKFRATWGDLNISGDCVAL